MKRYIKATYDFRTFDGYFLDELEENDKQLYIDVFHDLRNDVEVAYISRNKDCPYIGAKDYADNYYVWVRETSEKFPDHAWYEVTFDELAKLMEAKSEDRQIDSNLF